MTLKNNRASLLWYFKLCATFHRHRWIQTWFTVQKRPIWVQIGDLFVPCDLEIWRMTLTINRASVWKRPIWVTIGHLLSRVTLNFDGWPSKTIGHLSYATSSFVQHFIGIGEFKLELRSRNDQFGSKSTIFLSRVTLKFDGWHWKTIGHLSYASSSFLHYLLVIGVSNWSYSPETVKRGFDLCDFDPWPMTSTFCMDITVVIGNNSLKCHDDTMIGT